MDSPKFIFDIHTQIIAEKRQEESTGVLSSCAVLNAISILKRDMRESFLKTKAKKKTSIVLACKPNLVEESYCIIIEEMQMHVQAKDELGFVYALLEISRRFLKREPFWFWMNQRTEKVEEYFLLPQKIESPIYKVKFRGWFFNDEVLLSHWNYKGSNENSFKMAYETLLRCGGNMVIPGTDLVGMRNRKLASDMGLYITHHHAEPLGAEMFARAYPDERPSFTENRERFLKLWEDAIDSQKEQKTIYALGFRGQGDCPFWSNDDSDAYNTDQKRGALISELIRLQRKMVEEKVDNPLFCTNLYGEIMELYDNGYLDLDDDIIKIYADNGYGKMVTRRRDNHLGRVVALPANANDWSGIYYHVSFYDLQAANHITMLPNSVDFVNRELDTVVEKGAKHYWLINCSNILPHVYYLDAIRRKWSGEEISDKEHSRYFADAYFDGNTQIASLYEKHADRMLSFGNHEDEHAGEQYYTENPRIIAYHLIRGEKEPIRELFWCTGNICIEAQVDFFLEKLVVTVPKLIAYEDECRQVYESLPHDGQLVFQSTLYLDARIHAKCAQGMLYFMQGIQYYFNQSYMDAFFLLGASAELYESANAIMRECEYDDFIGFFANDCFADMKHTAYMIRKLMGVIREFGDNVRHDAWYRSLMYRKEDQQIFTQLVLDNHMTDEKLWEVLSNKKKGK